MGSFHLHPIPFLCGERLAVADARAQNDAVCDVPRGVRTRARISRKFEIGQHTQFKVSVISTRLWSPNSKELGSGATARPGAGPPHVRPAS